MSAQLELRLNDEVREIPWGGRSPRELTKIRKLLFLRHTPREYERFFADPDQYDMFAVDQKGPPVYGGAPLLLPLKRR